LGLAQARALAERLRPHAFTALYSSDLGRAQETARVLAQPTGQTVRLDSRLRERNLGVLQGCLEAEARARHPEAFKLFEKGGPDAVVPGGESARQHAEGAMASLTDLARRHAGETIVVVTHGGVLSGFLRLVLGLPFETPRRFRRRNASWNVFTFSEGIWTVESWGDTSHLEDV